MKRKLVAPANGSASPEASRHADGGGDDLRWCRWRRATFASICMSDMRFGPYRPHVSHLRSAFKPTAAIVARRGSVSINGSGIAGSTRMRRSPAFARARCGASGHRCPGSAIDGIGLADAGGRGPADRASSLSAAVHASNSQAIIAIGGARPAAGTLQPFCSVADRTEEALGKGSARQLDPARGAAAFRLAVPAQSVAWEFDPRDRVPRYGEILPEIRLPARIVRFALTRSKLSRHFPVDTYRKGSSVWIGLVGHERSHGPLDDRTDERLAAGRGPGRNSCGFRPDGASQEPR